MQSPEREQQIIQSHAAFICQAVEFIQRPEADTRLDALLNAAAKNGWTALATAVRLFAEGKRDLKLIAGLDDEDRVLWTWERAQDELETGRPADAAPFLRQVRDASGRIEAVVVAGKGWGHGVGLCQYGAQGMAEAGARFRAILQHYYPGAELVRLSGLAHHVDGHAHGVVGHGGLEAELLRAEVADGGRPLVDVDTDDKMQIVIEEIKQDKIFLDTSMNLRITGESTEAGGPLDFDPTIL